MIASMVPLYYLNVYWPKVAPMLQRAIDRQDKCGLDDIYLWLINGDAVLWVVEDETADHDVVGTVVSRIVQHPRRRILFLDLLGGKRGAGGTITSMTWKDAMLDILRRWAKVNECDAIEFIGRAGWAEVFKNDGCTIKHYDFELPVEA